jgi:hypothetical protein
MRGLFYVKKYFPKINGLLKKLVLRESSRKVAQAELLGKNTIIGRCRLPVQ